MSGPADFIARHRRRYLAPALADIAQELARIARLTNVGTASEPEMQWITRLPHCYLAEVTGLHRVHVTRLMGRLYKLNVIERRGHTYVLLGVAEHDATIRGCDHEQCQAEVRGAETVQWSRSPFPATGQPSRAARAVRVALYRHFDAGGTLLYVGVTRGPRSRFSSHAMTAKWWQFIDHATVEWHPDRPAALAAEAAAIACEMPLFNVDQAPDGTTERAAAYLLAKAG